MPRESDEKDPNLLALIEQPKHLGRGTFWNLREWWDWYDRLDKYVNQRGCDHIFPDGTRCTLTAVAHESIPGLASVHRFPPGLQGDEQP